MVKLFTRRGSFLKESPFPPQFDIHNRGILLSGGVLIEGPRLWLQDDGVKRSELVETGWVRCFRETAQKEIPSPLTSDPLRGRH